MKGFTAVELVIVLLILAVLAGVFLPALGRTEPQKAVAAARDAFASLHMMARASAIQSGRTARLRIQAPSRIWVEVTQTTGAIDTLGTPLYLDSEFADVRVSSDRTTICYGPRGLPVQPSGCDAPGATLIFQKGAFADTVTISPAGRLLR